MADRPPQRRGAEALAGLVAEMLRRAAHAGFTADEVASATFAAATERKRPGPLVGVLFADAPAPMPVTTPTAHRRFLDVVEVEGALLDDLPERLDRFHYDLVATTTFHADEAQAFVAGRVPVVAMLVGPGYVELVHEIAGFDRSKVGLVCASERGADNIRETLALAGTTGIELVLGTTQGADDELDRINETADVILVSREALRSASTSGSTALSGCATGRTSSTRRAWSSSAARSSTHSRTAWSPSRPSNRREGSDISPGGGYANSKVRCGFPRPADAHGRRH